MFFVCLLSWALFLIPVAGSMFSLIADLVGIFQDTNSVLLSWVMENEGDEVAIMISVKGMKIIMVRDGDFFDHESLVSKQRFLL